MNQNLVAVSSASTDLFNGRVDSCWRFLSANCEVGLCCFSGNQRDDDVRIEDLGNTAEEWERVTLVTGLFDR